MANGKFVWYELMTPDVEAAKAFYTHAIGWTTETVMDGRYTVLKAGGEGVGGMKARTADLERLGVPPHWTGLVVTDDVDATAKRAEALGGRTLKGGTDVPDIGRFAVLADPQGAAFTVFSPGTPTHRTFLAPRAIGNVAWHELNTTDYESAWKFYSELFGWKPTESLDMGEFGTYFMFSLPGEEAMAGGMSNVAAKMNMPPHWLYYVTVEDIDAAVKRITDGGGQILNGPMEVPGGARIAQCMDPQGAAFAIFAE